MKLLSTTMVCMWCVTASAIPAKAAEITVHSGDGFKLIGLEGQIVSGDEEKFRKIALNIDEAIVILSSNGGSLAPALDIGKTIQIRGYTTYIPAGITCVSSCALIWTAGSKRLLSKSGRVGFHASYRDNNGHAEEVGMANAMVGRYLTLLNLPEEAVMFATAASPSEISWIDTNGHDESGISFKIFDIDETPTQVAPPPIQTMPAPAQTVATARSPTPQWYYATTTDEGSIYYVRGTDIEESRKSSRSAIFWVKTNDSKNKTIERRASMQKYTVDCVAETYRMGDFVIYDRAGNASTIPGQSATQSIVPDSIFSEVTALVCSDNMPVADSRDLP